MIQLPFVAMVIQPCRILNQISATSCTIVHYKPGVFNVLAQGKTLFSLLPQAKHVNRLFLMVLITAFIELDDGIRTLGKFDLIIFGEYREASVLCIIDIRVVSRDNGLNEAFSKHLNKSIKDLDLSLCTETKFISISYVIVCTKTLKVAYQVDS